MASLFLPYSVSSSSPPPSLSMVIPTNPISRLQKSNLNLQPASFNRVWFSTPARERAVVVKASSEIDGKDPEGANAATGTSEVAVPMESLPLESKQQLKLEQKLRMKLAKKIRLRRKRLVRKRRMRKKGRWPPSKMKKNKNV